MNPKVDAYLDGLAQWRDEIAALRAIALDSGLVEELKWGHPCYTLDGKNVVLIHGFKGYCALLFFKGVLMKDPKGILVTQTENVQAGRHIRFTSIAAIVKQKRTLKSYIREAIGVEKSGEKVPMKQTEDFAMPDEFAARLKKTPALKKAFEALTPGRQRAYLLHFAQARQSGTRESRIDKCTPMILDGKGLNDR